jgi:hypothetical protein
MTDCLLEVYLLAVHVVDLLFAPIYDPLESMMI